MGISITKIFIVILSVLMLPAPALLMSEQDANQTAICIGRVAVFTKWPDNAESGEYANKFIITVIGDMELKNAIEKEYKQKKINSKTVKVNYISVNSLAKINANKIVANHILFISELSNLQIENILNLTKDIPVLTMSNTDGYAAKGVILNFYQTDSKMPFEVNFKCLQKSGIHIDALLLENVRIVESNYE